MIKVELTKDEIEMVTTIMYNAYEAGDIAPWDKTSDQETKALAIIKKFNEARDNG